MFKRLLEIIKWVPRAPTGMTDLQPGMYTCDYCGSGDSLFNYENSHCICHACQKKIADKVLLENSEPQQ